ncbi:phosphatidylinositol phosphatase PTPRQ-like [Saccostrea echinata]|uniref:phosphatidylinositol phosphatase PTPRQ-like n=1 Tax=Saccostrea echinata TaxID=191078 RepID=UPI002A820259|nr:phosphatidylinositol phosphatase PTPRQ-like [Saccostrea echinata]
MAYSETIRITPTRPKPPNDVSCPQQPKDISLEISWEPPTNPNGQIVMYQIHINPGSPGGRIINTTNNATSYNVMGLSPVSSPPTYLSIYEIGSRVFKISFEIPENVKGQLAAYRIVILEGSTCVQEIFLVGNCPQCMSLVDCADRQFVLKPDITQPVVHQVKGLKPYTHYVVKVAAVNGNGEGRFNIATVKTDEEIPQKPGHISSTNIMAKSLTLSWDVAAPSPGNTTYTIYVYEGTDDTGTNFNRRQPKLKAYGFHQKSVSLDELEEYWPYKFKVDAATIKGNTTSDLSDIVRTKQAAPGQVENLTVKIKVGDYRTAYVSWSIPSLKEWNGVLENYHFKISHKGEERKSMSGLGIELGIPASLVKCFTY